MSVDVAVAVIKPFHLTVPEVPRKQRRARIRRAWTKEEDRLLKRMYPKHGAKHTAEILGRTVTSVLHRARRLEVPGSRGRSWSEMELRYLKSKYPKHSIDQICRTLQRSRESVRGKINQLHLGPDGWIRWTDDEVEYLRKHYGRVKIADLAEELGRTSYAVELKAARLGLRRKLVKLTDAQIAQVVENLGKVSYAKMAAELGVDVKTLRRIGAKHGFYARPSIRAWTDEEDQFLRDNYAAKTQRAIAEELERTVDSVSWRLDKLGISKRA
jgi:hypothetical protein